MWERRRPRLGQGAGALVAALLGVACSLASPPLSAPPAAASLPSQSPTAVAGSPGPTGTLPPAAAPTRPAATATPLAPSPSPGLAATLGPTRRGRADNFTLLGHDPLAGRGWNAGLALAYPCAYVGNRRLAEIAIVDVSDPTLPQPAGQLSLAPGLLPVEVRAVPELGLLVVMNFSPGVSLMTFDVHDCRHPRALATLALGGAPHEFYLWRDPAQPGRLLVYVAMWAHQHSDLQVADLSDPSAPRRLGQWSAAGQVAGTLHSVSLSPDGRTAYLAMWEGGFVLANVSDFALARPEPSLHVLNPDAALLPPPGVNVHSAVPLPGTQQVLLTQEIYTCPFGSLSVADIADPTHPQLVGGFRLPENDPGCGGLPQADAVFTAHNPLVVGKLAFVTWYGGGLQALDLSQPGRPTRVGLFVPDGTGPAGGSPYGAYAVQLWSYPILRAGVLYVSDIRSGLYILRYTGPGAPVINAVRLAQGNANTVP